MGRGGKKKEDCVGSSPPLVKVGGEGRRELGGRGGPLNTLSDAPRGQPVEAAHDRVAQTFRGICLDLGRE